MIVFNKPAFVGTESDYVLEAIRSGELCGDKKYSKKCSEWFLDKFNFSTALLTPNCTQALEMAAILIDVKPGDEIIMPSYTFVSTANAFVLRGAKIVFVDIRKDTMNIDEKKIEQAITLKTKAIVPVHYAGVACEMDAIMEIADRHGLYVIEDAAQGMMATYKGRALGGIGHIGAFSFHETKNYTSGGEGGLLIVNDGQFSERAEIIREKGTNRSKFYRGMVDKYSWVDIGSSYLPSEVQAAYLWAQLLSAKKINEKRVGIWNKYYEELSLLMQLGCLDLPIVPAECTHNAHMFYIKTKNFSQRVQLIEYLKKNNIMAVFHYVPLHSSKAGIDYAGFHGDDEYTTRESERLLRLPLFYNLCDNEQNKVIDVLKAFYSE